MSELQSELLVALGEKLLKYGFSLKKSKSRFLKQSGDITCMFLLACIDAKPGVCAQPSIAIRFECIEQLFHYASGFEEKYQEDTATVGPMVRELVGAGFEYHKQFIVTSRADVEPVAARLFDVFKTYALPYYERFSSLAAVDQELNSSPTEHTIHRGGPPFFRCARGIIVAKLTGRDNYNDLVATYSEEMSRLNRGRNLNQFKRLLERLDAINAERCL